MAKTTQLLTRSLMQPLAAVPASLIDFGGVSGPKLNYSAVLLITGDSQSVGTLSAADQAAAVAAYVPTSRVLVRNAAGAFVPYTPGTITGMDHAANTGKVGSEIGFIPAFRAVYPNDTLYIIKEGESGSFQTRGVASGTAANITSTGGNTYTLNSGAILNGGNTLITGTGIETGVYIPFAGFLSKVGASGGRSGPAFGPTALTQYNGTTSWSSTEGLIYNGNSASITNGVRARIVAGLALLTAPKVVTHLHYTGTNDAGLADASAFPTDLDGIFTRFNADLTSAYANVKQVLARVGTGITSSTPVRAAQLAKRDQIKICLLDTDTYVRWDLTHWDLAAHTDMGNKAFGFWQGTFTGI